VGFLALAVLAARVGTTVPARNLAPVLLTAVAVPTLTVASLALGPVWRRIDPFDGLARLLRAPEGAGEGHVWVAVGPAFAGVAYLTAYPAGLEPRVLGLVAGGYVLLTLAGCLALGRLSWLERREPIGLLLTWFGGLRRRALSDWAPPEGAGALLGVVGGGLVFGLIRGTSLYVSAAFAVGPRAADFGGVALFAAVGATVMVLAERIRRDGTATAAAVPVVAGIVLAHALAQARLLFALQLLPGLLIDPFGRGWTVGGLGQTEVRLLPFGVTTVVLVQLTLVVIGGVAAARVVRQRTAGRGRIAAPVGAVLALVMAGVLGVTTA
jgi:hypothetical protein